MKIGFYDVAGGQSVEPDGVAFIIDADGDVLEVFVEEGEADVWMLRNDVGWEVIE